MKLEYILYSGVWDHSVKGIVPRHFFTSNSLIKLLQLGPWFMSRMDLAENYFSRSYLIFNFFCGVGYNWRSFPLLWDTAVQIFFPVCNTAEEVFPRCGIHHWTIQDVWKTFLLLYPMKKKHFYLWYPIPEQFFFCCIPHRERTFCGVSHNAEGSVPWDTAEKIDTKQKNISLIFSVSHWL